jgi:hypothetical protein
LKRWKNDLSYLLYLHVYCMQLFSCQGAPCVVCNFFHVRVHPCVQARFLHPAVQENVGVYVLGNLAS